MRPVKPPVANGTVVVGAGCWGTAVARLLAEAARPARLVCRTAAQAEDLRAQGRNSRHLPDATLPRSLEVTHLGDEGALADAGLVAIAVPSRATGAAGAWLAPRLPAGAGVLLLTKGLEPETGRRLSQAWGDMLAPGTPLAVLSGPNLAQEVAAGNPAAAVVAGDPDLGLTAQERLSGPRFRVYQNGDLVGVELCAAAKNVIAVAAGMSDGLGLGDNSKAALITRGLAEMTRLGLAYGAEQETFRGLAGMGDLVATCTSPLSRNRRAGELIAGGVPLEAVEGHIGQVAEGIWTVDGLLRLAAAVRLDGCPVELPISAEVAAVLAGKPVLEGLESLMSRALVAER